MDQTPADRLKQTRRMAGAVLAGMAVAFLGSYLLPASGPVLLIRSMAEAGMIGGLADWFAVTALFRHPLGIPIPHTALLPRNQRRAAINVGRFFETNFLQPDQIRTRILALHPSALLASWLERPENAQAIAAQISDLVAALLRHDPSPRLMVRLRQWLRAQALDFGADDAVARGVADAVKSGLHGQVPGKIIHRVAEAIDARRDIAASLVQDQSRWWIASTVDKRLANVIVDGVLALLQDLAKGDSRFSRDIARSIDDMVDTLLTEGTLTQAVAGARQYLLDSGKFDQAMAALLHQMRGRLSDQLRSDPDALTRPLADFLRDTARRGLSDPDARAALDARLSTLAGQIIGQAAPQIAAYVTDVIAGWPPEELNERFEQEIGPDLQFIRINGAVLGALIGGVLFAVEALLG